jgi:hypothetical protein
VTSFEVNDLSSNNSDVVGGSLQRSPGLGEYGEGVNSRGRYVYKHAAAAASARQEMFWDVQPDIGRELDLRE